MSIRLLFSLPQRILARGSFSTTPKTFFLYLVHCPLLSFSFSFSLILASRPPPSVYRPPPTISLLLWSSRPTLTTVHLSLRSACSRPRPLPPVFCLSLATGLPFSTRRSPFSSCCLYYVPTALYAHCRRPFQISRCRPTLTCFLSPPHTHPHSLQVIASSPWDDFYSHLHPSRQSNS
ncbi:hypothetical protein BC826DRAFT_737082 [Russula brevipes]|nr:hypothetical protein BC826DRAFT_737082 [Russula brevipes]